MDYWSVEKNFEYVVFIKIIIKVDVGFIFDFGGQQNVHLFWHNNT